VKNYLFDASAGASWGGSSSSPPKVAGGPGKTISSRQGLDFLTTAFKRSDIDFDYIEAWDPRVTAEADFEKTVPEELRGKLNFHNTYVGWRRGDGAEGEGQARAASVERPGAGAGAGKWRYDEVGEERRWFSSAAEAEEWRYGVRGNTFDALGSTVATNTAASPFLPQHIRHFVGGRRGSYVAVKLRISGEDDPKGQQSPVLQHYLAEIARGTTGIPDPGVRCDILR
jgi:hypothetical protein